MASVCFDVLMGTPVSAGLRFNKKEAIGHVSSSQETERDDAVLKLFTYFPLVQYPIPGVVPFTFKVGFSSSSSLKKKLPPRHIRRFVSLTILDPVKLTVSATTGPKLRLIPGYQPITPQMVFGFSNLGS